MPVRALPEGEESPLMPTCVLLTGKSTIKATALQVDKLFSASFFAPGTPGTIGTPSPLAVGPGRHISVVFSQCAWYVNRMPDQENPIFIPQRRYFRLHRRDLAYLTFIVEACEGMATLSTIDTRETLVSLTTLPCRAADLDDFIKAIKKEIDMTETTPAFGHPLPAGRDRGRAPGDNHHARHA